MMGAYNSDETKPTMRSDAELLIEYRTSRSRDALNEIYERHATVLALDCYRIVRNQNRAEEAANLALLILARRPDVVSGALADWLREAARCIAGNGSDQRLVVSY